MKLWLGLVCLAVLSRGQFIYKIPPAAGGNYFTGTSRTAATCEEGDVQAKIDLSSDLDIVVIPSGTCTWTSAVTNSSKAILLVGAAACTYDSNGRSTSCPTVIHNGNASYALYVGAPANKYARVSSLEFVSDAASSAGGVLQLQAANTDTRRIRIDHVVITASTAGASAFFPYQAYGVIDHSTFNTTNPAGIAEINGRLDGSEFGHQNWFDGAQFGSDKFLFFENDNLNGSYGGTMIDSHYGARWVLRYSTIVDGTMEGHGTEGNGERGTMAKEIYNNLWTQQQMGFGFVGFTRSGTELWHDNAIYDPIALPALIVKNPRIIDPNCCWGMADGRNQHDINDAGNPFTTGTCTSVGTLTCTVSGTPWTTNQYQGYQVRRTSGGSVKTCASLTNTAGTGTATCNTHGFSNGNLVSLFGAAMNTGALAGWQMVYHSISNVTANTFDFALYGGAESISNVSSGEILAVKGGGWSAYIDSNTLNTLTFRASVQEGNFPGSSLSFTAGDNFEINKVTQVLDGIGRTGGSLLSGGTPSPPSGGNDQTTFTSYQWNNFRCTSGPPTAGCSHTETAKFSLDVLEGMNYADDSTPPVYAPYAYPHPLIAATLGPGAP